MRTARQVACEFGCMIGGSNQTIHGDRCDRLTAAIKARDGEHRRDADTICTELDAERESRIKATAERAAALAALSVAREALHGIDFGRVRADGYCEACEECDSEDPCIHRLAHDSLTRISELVPS